VLARAVKLGPWESVREFVHEFVHGKSGFYGL